MLHADLGGVLDLLVRTVQGCDEARGGHRTGDAHFAHATHLRTRDRCVLLVEHADSSGGEQETNDAIVVRADLEAAVVVEHCRHDAGRPVRRRRDDSPTRRVLFIHGERPGVHPVHHFERIGGAAAFGEQAVELGRAAANLEHAG